MTIPVYPERSSTSTTFSAAGWSSVCERWACLPVPKPINDITVNGRKISGNAQTRRFHGILQHGTLLCDVDPHLMFTLLKVPNEKIRDKLIAGVEERVTSIRREMGSVDRERVTQALDRRLRRGTGYHARAGRAHRP